MNKLRKSAPVSPPATPSKSRTMALAQTAARMVTAPGSTVAPNYFASAPQPEYALETYASTHIQSSSISVPRPKTAQEQYWAARALTAETLLSARTVHQQELKSVTIEADTKRMQETDLLRKAHEARESRLEKLVIVLSILLLSLAAMFAYSLYSTAKAERSRKSSNIHFTIPILSPWASVVEHEMSVIGPRLLTAFAAMLAICLYGCFRYWLKHRNSR